MNPLAPKSRFTLPFRLVASAVLVTFVSMLPVPVVLGQEALLLPAPGARVALSPGFAPPLLKGITVHPENPLQFDFLLSPGEEPLSEGSKTLEYERLIKYFLAALTVPEKDIWVNLSPYEGNRMIAENLGQTEMGRDLLAQDYLLKQITASLIYPEEELGKAFWDKIHKEAQARFNTSEIPMNTFNKVWIVPDDAVVYEHGSSAFVIHSHLKVMLEQDYLSLKNNSANAKLGTDSVDAQDVEEASRISSQVVREIVIPALEKEVNEGKNFAPLRQVFQSVILAAWYKKALQESLLGKVYVDQGKVKGVDQKDISDNQKIYGQYVAAFKQGVFNYIKEDVDPLTQEAVPRKYFSGGVSTALDGALLGDRIVRARSLAEVPPSAMKDLVDLQGNPPIDNASVRLGEPGETARVRGDAAALSERPLEGKKVLVIDNDANDLFLTARQMKKIGGEVTESESAKKALENLDLAGFDLILVDMNMPDMDGVNFLKALRERQAKAPVILLSGTISPNDRKRLTEEGLDQVPIMEKMDAPGLVKLVAEVTDAAVFSVRGQNFAWNEFLRGINESQAAFNVIVFRAKEEDTNLFLKTNGFYIARPRPGSKLVQIIYKDDEMLDLTVLGRTMEEIIGEDLRSSERWTRVRSEFLTNAALRADGAILAEPVNAYKDFYAQFGAMDRSADETRITQEAVNSFSRKFLTTDARMLPPGERRLNETWGVTNEPYGVTEVYFVPQGEAQRRMVAFQSELKELFGDKVYLVDADKLHFTIQGLEQQWDDQAAGTKKPLALHSGLDKIDLNSGAILQVREKARSISTQAVKMQVARLNFNPQTGIFWELRPYLTDPANDPVKQRRKDWQLPEPRPPHITAAYFTQEFTAAEEAQLRALLTKYSDITHFGDIDVDNVQVIAYSNFAFNASEYDQGYVVLESVALKTDGAMLARLRVSGEEVDRQFYTRKWDQLAEHSSDPRIFNDLIQAMIGEIDFTEEGQKIAAEIGWSSPEEREALVKLASISVTQEDGDYILVSPFEISARPTPARITREQFISEIYEVTRSRRLTSNGVDPELVEEWQRMGMAHQQFNADWLKEPQNAGMTLLINGQYIGPVEGLLRVSNLPPFKGPVHQLTFRDQNNESQSIVVAFFQDVAILSFRDTITPEQLRTLKAQQLSGHPYLVALFGNTREEKFYQPLEPADPESSSLADFRAKESEELLRAFLENPVTALAAPSRSGKTEIMTPKLKAAVEKEGGRLFYMDVSIFRDMNSFEERFEEAQSDEPDRKVTGIVLDEFRPTENVNRDMIKFLQQAGIEHILLIAGGRRANSFKKKDFLTLPGLSEKNIIEMGIKPYNARQTEEALREAVKSSRIESGISAQEVERNIKAVATLAKTIPITWRLVESSLSSKVMGPNFDAQDSIVGILRTNAPYLGDYYPLDLLQNLDSAMMSIVNTTAGIDTADGHQYSYPQSIEIAYQGKTFTLTPDENRLRSLFAAGRTIQTFPVHYFVDGRQEDPVTVDLRLVEASSLTVFPVTAEWKAELNSLSRIDLDRILKKGDNAIFSVGEWRDIQDKIVFRFGWGKKLTPAEAQTQIEQMNAPRDEARDGLIFSSSEQFDVFFMLGMAAGRNFDDGEVVYDIFVRPKERKAATEQDFYKGHLTFAFQGGRITEGKDLWIPDRRMKEHPWLERFIKEKVEELKGMSLGGEVSDAAMLAVFQSGEQVPLNAFQSIEEALKKASPAVRSMLRSGARLDTGDAFKLPFVSPSGRVFDRNAQIIINNMVKADGTMLDVNPRIEQAGIAGLRANPAAQFDAATRKVGGIDIGNITSKLQIKRDDSGIPLPMQFQDIGNINIEGFVPTILEITPVTNLPLLMGLNENANEPTAALDQKPAAKYARLD
jgi:CheY-like chemotaxis protein